jgi:hypothetical protein
MLCKQHHAFFNIYTPSLFQSTTKEKSQTPSNSSHPPLCLNKSSPCKLDSVFDEVLTEAQDNDLMDFNHDHMNNSPHDDINSRPIQTPVITQREEAYTKHFQDAIAKMSDDQRGLLVIASISTGFARRVARSGNIVDSRQCFEFSVTAASFHRLRPNSPANIGEAGGIWLNNEIINYFLHVVSTNSMIQGHQRVYCVEVGCITTTRKE